MRKQIQPPLILSMEDETEENKEVKEPLDEEEAEFLSFSQAQN